MKGIGYAISTLSVLLLGIVAWPKPDEAPWKAWVLAAGMALSIAGMGVRYLSHRKERREIKRAEREAERQ